MKSSLERALGFKKQNHPEPKEADNRYSKSHLKISSLFTKINQMGKGDDLPGEHQQCGHSGSDQRKSERFGLGETLKINSFLPPTTGRDTSRWMDLCFMATPRTSRDTEKGPQVAQPLLQVSVLLPCPIPQPLMPLKAKLWCWLRYFPLGSSAFPPSPGRQTNNAVSIATGEEKKGKAAWSTAAKSPFVCAYQHLDLP